MSLRQGFKDLLTRIFYWLLALRAKEEVQASHTEAVESAVAGLRSTMAALDEAEQYLKEDEVDPAKREIVSTFRVEIMLMSEQVGDMLRTPLSDAEARKERLNAPFDRSTNSEDAFAAVNGNRRLPELTTMDQGGESLPPPNRPGDPSPQNGSLQFPSRPSLETAEPPKRRRGRPPGTGKRQREAREQAAREAMEPQSRTTQPGDGNAS